MNSRVRATYDEAAGRLTSLNMDGNEVRDEDRYSICLQGFHARNSEAYLGISQGELTAIKAKVASTSAQEVLEEWLKTHQNTGRNVEGRLTYI